MRLPSKRTFSVTDAIDGRTLVVLTRTSSLRVARREAQAEAKQRGYVVSLVCQTPTDRVLVDQYYPA